MLNYVDKRWLVNRIEAIIYIKCARGALLAEKWMKSH